MLVVCVCHCLVLMVVLLALFSKPAMFVMDAFYFHAACEPTQLLAQWGSSLGECFEMVADKCFMLV